MGLEALSSLTPEHQKLLVHGLVSSCLPKDMKIPRKTIGDHRRWFVIGIPSSWIVNDYDNPLGITPYQAMNQIPTGLLNLFTFQLKALTICPSFSEIWFPVSI
jgi:membrane glycosyltransferase